MRGALLGRSFRSSLLLQPRNNSPAIRGAGSVPRPCRPRCRSLWLQLFQSCCNGCSSTRRALQFHSTICGNQNPSRRIVMPAILAARFSSLSHSVSASTVKERNGPFKESYRQTSPNSLYFGNVTRRPALLQDEQRHEWVEGRPGPGGAASSHQAELDFGIKLVYATRSCSLTST